MTTHNLCFKQKYEKYQNFYLKTFIFLVVKFSIYLNRRVFVMKSDMLTLPGVYYILATKLVCRRVFAIY